jgi:hypothetical protein
VGETERAKGLDIVTVATVLTLLIGTLGGLTALRRGRQNEPGQVAYDYQAAILAQDFARAYGHLSASLANHPPSSSAFEADLKRYEALPDYEIDPCVYAGEVQVEGDEATAHLRVQYYDPCTGAEVQNLTMTPSEVRLRREGGQWKIVYAGLHFVQCWADPDACE